MSKTKPQPDTSKQGWREKFETKFGVYIALGEFGIAWSADRNEVEDFIQQEIDKAVKEERERIAYEYGDYCDSKCGCCSTTSLVTELRKDSKIEKGEHE